VKADVFSLGMTILSAVVYSDTNCLYNFDNFKIKYKKITKHLENVEEGYSVGLADILRAMLERKPENRKDPVEIMRMINDHFIDNEPNKDGDETFAKGNVKEDVLIQPRLV